MKGIITLVPVDLAEPVEVMAPMPTPSIKNFYIASALSMQAHGDARYQIIDGSGCLVLARNAQWQEAQAIVAVFDTPAEERQGGALLEDWARLTFRAQPTRQYLLGLCVFVDSRKAKVWVLDRVGTSLLESFDIGNFGEEVDAKLDELMKKSREDLGMDTFVQTDDERNFFLENQLEDGRLERFYMRPSPLYLNPRQVTDSAVACYRGRAADSAEWNLVIKFVWRPEKLRPEEDLLAMVVEKGIQGVVSLRGLKNLDNVARFRLALGDDTIVQESFVNSFFSCIVTTPYGRRLTEHRTIPELLEALRDAIMGHRSLYRDANVLHQDISLENIVITDGEGPRGTLIDLGLAMDLDAVKAAEGQITGTKELMAIGVLRRELHTYRHDLESFFYVFLWISICHPNGYPPTTSLLQDWSRGRWTCLAHMKAFHMGADRFQEILSEFSPRFGHLKQLAQDLREALFRSEREPFTGTDMSQEATDKLYQDMADAFDRAIRGI